MMASEDAQKHRAGPELEHVLNRHQTGLHGQLTCRLLASHSYDHETSYLTALSKAHDQVVDYFVCGNSRFAAFYVSRLLVILSLISRMGRYVGCPRCHSN